MNKFNLLAIDDDNLVLQALRMAITDPWHLIGVNSLEEVPKDKIFHTALVDMHLTGDVEKTEGIEAIKYLSKRHPHLEIVAQSGDLNRELMESCLQAGASRFLAKPLNFSEVQLTLDKIEALLLLHDASNRAHYKAQPLIGSSQPIVEIKKQIAALRGEKGPILIEGDSGTGKEVIASLLHAQSPARPFICVNVAAISENLFESEFFGHVKGAFTGAAQNKMGLAEAAHGGDLFLDEIEALSLPLQAKLLRFLESGEIRRVGSDKNIFVDCRVIAATNKNLNEMVENNEFREDLLWRVNGKKIVLPTLRERNQDIKELATYFINKDPVRKKSFSEDAVEKLVSYHWPGNVRELRRVCEQLIMQSPLPIIRGEDIRLSLNNSTKPIVGDSLDFLKGLNELTKEFEKTAIKSCLNKYTDVDEVSNILKISKSNLYKKIKDYNIEWRS